MTIERNHCKTTRMRNKFPFDPQIWSKITIGKNKNINKYWKQIIKIINLYDHRNFGIESKKNIENLKLIPEIGVMEFETDETEGYRSHIGKRKIKAIKD